MGKDTKMNKSTNIVWHESIIKRNDREILNGNRSACIWFTGLPSSGKSTIAREVEYILYIRRIRTYVLDGDNVRHGLNSNLGFSPEDRKENIRRIGEVAKLFVDAGIVVCTAFISPYRKDRDFVRNLLGKGDFIEVFVDCPVEVCEKRDPKGLYKKARAGEIKGFTGVDDPYEPPLHPEIVLNTAKVTEVHRNALQVVQYLEEHGYIQQPGHHKLNFQG